jgi:hypothetical protein
MTLEENPAAVELGRRSSVKGDYLTGLNSDLGRRRAARLLLSRGSV